MAACAMATALSHVSMHGNYSYTAISAVVAACPNQLDAEGIHRNYIRTLYLLIQFLRFLSSGNIVMAAQPRRGRDLVMQQFLLFATTNITTTQVSKEAFKSSVFLYFSRDKT